MPRRILNLSPHERVLRQLRREHEGITDYLESIEPYLQAHPEDKAIQGQAKHFRARLQQIAVIMGQHENRETVKKD